MIKKLPVIKICLKHGPVVWLEDNPGGSNTDKLVHGRIKDVVGWIIGEVDQSRLYKIRNHQRYPTPLLAEASESRPLLVSESFCPLSKRSLP